MKGVRIAAWLRSMGRWLGQPIVGRRKSHPATILVPGKDQLLMCSSCYGVYWHETRGKHLVICCDCGAYVTLYPRHQLLREPK